MQPIEFFFRAAARMPNEIAVYAPDRRLTFGDLASQVMSLAAYLKAVPPHENGYPAQPAPAAN